MKDKKLVCLFAGLILLLGTTFLATPAMASHAWANYHLATTAYPIQLQVVDSISSDWQFEFDTALAEWNQSSKLDMSITSVDESSKSRKRCSAVSGQMRVCNASYGGTGWAGLASINLDSNGHITQGTAKMNDFYQMSPDFRRHVMCQEIGHVFGLGHTSEDGSSQQTCMDYSNDPNSISPNNHDYALLDTIYNHTENYNSWDDGSSGGGGGGNGGCNPNSPKCNPSGFNPPHGVPFDATLVRRGPHAEMWVKPGAQGSMWVYHVYLIDGPDGHSH